MLWGWASYALQGLKMNKKELQYIDRPIITKVANGYFIRPDRPSEYQIRDDEIYVFESFEHMIMYLKKLYEKNN